MGGPEGIFESLARREVDWEKGRCLGMKIADLVVMRGIFRGRRVRIMIQLKVEVKKLYVPDVDADLLDMTSMTSVGLAQH